ncbi:MAG: hypothetical protein JRH10_12100 [Deltaproteobacteria bacterium]|nr:hypothetical protein [Deltaproteobacteria bacterium]MBW2446053.1 hypothetical protein [Deltaproteobacteria bacterium]
MQRFSGPTGVSGGGAATVVAQLDPVGGDIEAGVAHHQIVEVGEAHRVDGIPPGRAADGQA